MKIETFIALSFFLLPIFSIGQTDSSYTLSGTVVDGVKNKILTGAHLLNSHKTGTKTTLNGEFTINTFYNDTITVSYIGYKTIKYITPKRNKGKYLTKFKLYRDSIMLDEVEIFPYPTYKEFKKAFTALNKEDEKIQIRGVKTYVDIVNTPKKPSILNPASYIYDRLFDKQAKLKRRLDKYRKTIKQVK
ncbi:MAG: carboxypeptidase-like regulatory domain-containing protein [Vicingaceae bacterium]|nr:carboxypeptidase-like regulatory domain-containing protein [Vicingaceae bacterium]